MLLLTVTVADPKWFTLKYKPVTYTGALVELYKWKNHEQIHKISMMIEFKKMHTLITKNLCNLGVYWIIEISSVLCNAYVVSRNQDKFVFYVQNYID